MLVAGIGMIAAASYIGSQECDPECELAEAQNPDNDTGFVVTVAGGAGIVLVVLALIELSPHLSESGDVTLSMEETVGKLLFFVYGFLSLVNLVFTVYCLVGESALGMAGSSSVLGDFVKQIGWASLLVLEFMILHAACNLWDWKCSKAAEDKTEFASLRADSRDVSVELEGP